MDTDKPSGRRPHGAIQGNNHYLWNEIIIIGESTAVCSGFARSLLTGVVMVTSVCSTGLGTSVKFQLSYRSWVQKMVKLSQSLLSLGCAGQLPLPTCCPCFACLLIVHDDTSPPVPVTKGSGSPLGSPPETRTGQKCPFYTCQPSICVGKAVPHPVSWAEGVLTRVASALSPTPLCPCSPRSPTGSGVGLEALTQPPARLFSVSITGSSLHASLTGNSHLFLKVKKKEWIMSSNYLSFFAFLLWGSRCPWRKSGCLWRSWWRNWEQRQEKDVPPPSLHHPA